MRSYTTVRSPSNGVSSRLTEKGVRKPEIYDMIAGKKELKPELKKLKKCEQNRPNGAEVATEGSLYQEDNT